MSDTVPDVLAARILATAPRCGATRLVCVDGPSGSGKTTFADGLGLPVVHMEDLYPGWDGLEQAVTMLLDEVVAPLAAGRAARHRCYDWERGEYTSFRDIGTPPVLVVEGVGAGARAIASYAVLLLWMDAPADERFRRAMERDGDTYRPYWERWARQERAHFAAEGTRARADVIMDGTW